MPISTGGHHVDLRSHCRGHLPDHPGRPAHQAAQQPALPSAGRHRPSSRALAYRAGRALDRGIYTEAVTALPEGMTEEDVDRLADRLIAAHSAGK
ncbi:MAG TPA: hypothetical protein VKZ82_06600 [Nonomuraea sp.]|nr:hypothetical protein [Nonomuraea sp.]